MDLRLAAKSPASGREWQLRQPPDWESIFRIVRCEARASYPSSWQPPALHTPSSHWRIRVVVRDRIRRAEEFANQRPHGRGDGLDNPEACWKLHAAIPARRPGFLR